CSFDLLFHFISLITTTSTYTCTLHILIIPTLLTSIAAILVPITVHIAYLFLTVHIYLFTYYTLHMHILCTFAILHFWLDAKLDFVASVLVLCAMTIKLNLKTNLKKSNLNSHNFRTFIACLHIYTHRMRENFFMSFQCKDRIDRHVLWGAVCKMLHVLKSCSVLVHLALSYGEKSTTIFKCHFFKHLERNSCKFI